MAEHRAEVGLGGEVELVLDAAGAVGAHPHLGGGLLAGHVEHPVAQPRGLRGDLEQQRGLADAGLAGEQDRRARDQAAAEHPVELGHAAGARQGVLDRHLADRSAPGAVTGPACTRLRGAARSTTVPQAWHSPQRPTHLTVSQPHSLQW